MSIFSEASVETKSEVSTVDGQVASHKETVVLRNKRGAKALRKVTVTGRNGVFWSERYYAPRLGTWVRVDWETFAAVRKAYRAEGLPRLAI